MALADPLRRQYDKFLNSKPVETAHDNVHNFLAALETLRHSELRDKLLCRLSQPQRVSLLLLEEWWKCYNGSETDSGKWILHQEGNPPEESHSQYNALLFDLWYSEFWLQKPRSGFEDSFEGTLQLALHLNRQRAAVIAASYRLAQALYERIISPASTSRRLSWISTDTLNVPYPSCLQACSWLVPSTEAPELPHYLWDNKTAETVLCPEGRPSYLVISHTWGRWEIHGVKVAVPGVPWMVPGNTLFEVINLPSILSATNVRYVWLDLVCIPQDGSPLQQREIARQASIFLSAEYAAVWMNRITDWNGLRAALNWMSCHSLNTWELGNGPGGFIPPEIKASAQMTTGLATITNEEDDPDVQPIESTPDGWFTSLWTLQEACLRPDMLLFDRNMNVCSVVDLGMPISLGYVIALARTTAGTSRTLPKGVLEIILTIEGSELYNLLEMSPLDVIIFGNRRYCKDTNRAVAIMSALGFTDWYMAKLNSTNDTVESIESFIEGRYPLEFVQEAKAKLGGVFFATMSNGIERHFEYDQNRTRVIGVKSIGTMLPFRNNLGYMIEGLVDPMCSEDHPSIKSWMILPDGSVEVPEAGIIASWPSETTKDVTAKVTAWVTGSPAYNVREAVGLSHWLGSFRPNSQKYALCLLRRAKVSCHGVLIERVYGTSQSNTFVKLGHFNFSALITEGHPEITVAFPQTVLTNWRIL